MFEVGWKRSTASVVFNCVRTTTKTCEILATWSCDIDGEIWIDFWGQTNDTNLLSTCQFRYGIACVLITNSRI